MNKLLQHYTVDVEFPDVSGAEQLEMLQLRDELHTIESTLSDAEKEILDTADKRLVERAAEFYAELSRFVDFEERRQSQQISIIRWWWYLDVLAQLPQPLPTREQEPITA